MKNKKKMILGAALLTSLTIFAAGNAVNSRTAATTSTAQSARSNTPQFNPQRVEELKNKLKNGTATKSEMAEAAQLLERKGSRGDKGNKNGTPGTNSNAPKVDTAKLDAIKTKIKNGSKLTNEEKEIVVQMLERKSRPKGERGPQNSGTNTTTTK